MPTKRKLILGTRGSPLALWQANHVKEILEEEYQDLNVSIKAITTTGDKSLKANISEIGGKGLFLKEIEEQLLAGKIHVGVHSMKDVPVELPRGLMISTILEREDPRDVFISKKYDSLLKLPKKAKLGTSSLRRRSQLKNFRPDFEILPIRGNVESRIRKLTSNKTLDGILLAAAGLSRLGMASKITEYLSTTLMLPAVAQGAIGLEIRIPDKPTRSLLDFMNHEDSSLCVLAERAFLKALGGDCQSPISAYAEIQGQALKLTGMVGSIDGRELIRDRIEGNSRDAISLGEQLAKTLLGHGAREILRVIHQK